MTRLKENFIPVSFAITISMKNTIEKLAIKDERSTSSYVRKVLNNHIIYKKRK